MRVCYGLVIFGNSTRRGQHQSLSSTANIKFYFRIIIGPRLRRLAGDVFVVPRFPPSRPVLDSRGVSRALVSGFLAGDTSPDTRRGRPTSRFYMEFIASVEVPSYGLTMLGLLRGDPQRSMSYLLGCVRASSPGNQG